MLRLLSLERILQALAKAPAVGVHRLAVGSAIIPRVPLDLALACRSNAVVGVEENPLADLEVVLQADEADGRRLVALALPIDCAATVVVGYHRREGGRPGVRHGCTLDVGEVLEDLLVLLLLALLRGELVLCHQLAGLQERGLGLRLVGALVFDVCHDLYLHSGT